jgi:hypothetical protein
VITARKLGRAANNVLGNVMVSGHSKSHQDDSAYLLCFMVVRLRNMSGFFDDQFALKAQYIFFVFAK